MKVRKHRYYPSKYFLASAMTRNIYQWIRKQNFDPDQLPDEIWGMILENLRFMGNLSGKKYDEIAKPLQADRTIVCRAIRHGIPRDLLAPLSIAQALGFNPQLLLVKNLRQQTTTFLNNLGNKMDYDQSVFSIFRKCKVCQTRSLDPKALFCSCCGARFK